ncbi:MAG: UvrD-helicase domain-containing protein [Polyangiales bacterium]
MTLAAPLADSTARTRIRDELDTTFVVEAAAGTGKTTALVSRIVSLVRRGKAELRGIVAVTFTEAAAGEMKLRLRASLESERVAENTHQEERDRLDRALAQLEEARISTIHSLCVDVLRERPVEARVDPLFQVAPDDDARRLFDQAFDLWFQRALEAPPPGMRRILRRRRRGRDPQSPREVLREAAFGLLDHRDFPALWRREPFDRDREIDALVLEIAEASKYATLADRADDYLKPIFVKLATFTKELARRESIRGRDHDGIEADLAELCSLKEWKWRGGGKWYKQREHTREEVLEVKDRIKQRVDRFCDLAAADLASQLHEELAPLAERYAKLKSSAGKLDFLDLLLCTRDLVRDHGEVRAELQRRFTHVFVDEFQDTDPMQAEILLLLSADDPSVSDWTAARPPPGKLFVVGDPKQSIYRFRRADVALYESVKRRLVARGAEVLHLVTSFRGAPSIQHAVNAAFSLRMLGNEAGTQAEYVPLSPFRADLPGQPAVVALPVPRPYSDYGKLANWAIDRSLPDAVGAFVDWLVRSSGWKVTEREEPLPVPVAARHVCLLFKRLQSWGTDTTRAYTRALEARGIAHVLVGGRSFHAREEVSAMRAVLSAVEWPDDELSVFAALRGPFLALSDETLLAFSAARGGSSPFHPLRPIEGTLDPSIAPVAEALAILAELHRARNRRPIADTIGRFLERTRAHAGIAIWPTGEQALANVLRMIDLARRFESSGATSFRAFIDWLEESADNGQIGEAPVVEQGTDGVRIMSVHKAKGLEFPVVILVDPTAPLEPGSPSRHVDHERGLWVERLAGCAPIELLERSDDVLRRDKEEAIRVGYVAATRARDLLVVPVVGDRYQPEREGWLDVLSPAFQPHPRDRRNAEKAAGCPDFGHDSVLQRPVHLVHDAEISLMPGEHKPEAGQHRVVVWDPHALSLDKEVDVGIRQQTILVADEEGGAAEATARAHDAWRAERERVLRDGARPTLPVISATAHAKSRAEGTIPVERVEGDRTGDPRGKRFGILVHAILAVVPLDDPSKVRALSEAHGRLLGATSAEIDAAARRAERALSHPLMKRAASSACRREVAVTLRAEDGTIVDGIVDLAFFTAEKAQEWVVVDFKTDAELDTEALATYAAQVGSYAAAISTATGEPARGVLLSV